ncbi:sugar-transfer associated ATP-grasp domain-containing protein [Aquimarina sp. RZ0]|uniref:sugar-transfer associated ATP-grasp domain-containing protein n=1 Tax=Aquimarina sp. RZ0 TaxID=2607730 RepID=UPI0011F13FC5|nr:sugar-transfer associated ATP-grasp domain-containing protein [Aquimarina sp. RZ0]KAA1246446.1 hypothetical protein F0000_07505 [Aquimarina sp. RZ0]
MTNKIALFNKRISVFIKDKNRKSLFRICKEAFIFWIVKKEKPYFYFGKFLYRKNILNYTDYLSNKEVHKITFSKNLHKYQFASLLRNKLSFAIYMEQNSFPVPKLISHNFKKQFYYKTKKYTINTSEELAQYIEMIFEKTQTATIFIKSMTEMGGTGCFLITKSNLNNQVSEHANYILSNECIHQEVVVQHPEINKIYAHSINTIRFDTYIDKNNNIHILSAFMRFGCGGNVVDNGSSGGIYLSVDIQKGELKGLSHQLMKYGGKQLQKHPDTHTQFDGFSIPYFTESLALVKKAVSYIPDRIIGWDIAISPDGPVIIEGNDNNSFITPDIAFGGYLKHPLFNEILEEA